MHVQDDIRQLHNGIAVISTQLLQSLNNTNTQYWSTSMLPGPNGTVWNNLSTSAATAANTGLALSGNGVARSVKLASDALKLPLQMSTHEGKKDTKMHNYM